MDVLKERLRRHVAVLAGEIHPGRRQLPVQGGSVVDVLAARFEGLPPWEAWREVRLPPV